MYVNKLLDFQRRKIKCKNLILYLTCLLPLRETKTSNLSVFMQFSSKDFELSDLKIVVTAGSGQLVYTRYSLHVIIVYKYILFGTSLWIVSHSYSNLRSGGSDEQLA